MALFKELNPWKSDYERSGDVDDQSDCGQYIIQDSYLAD